MGQIAASCDGGWMKAMEALNTYRGGPDEQGHFGGATLYFKRDELNHTGAHKINNCLG